MCAFNSFKTYQMQVTSLIQDSIDVTLYNEVILELYILTFSCAGVFHKVGIQTQVYTITENLLNIVPSICYKHDVIKCV